MMVINWWISLPFKWKLLRLSPTSVHTLLPLFLCRPILQSQQQWQWVPSQWMMLALLAVDNQWPTTTMIHSTTLGASQWTFLHYSIRYYNLQMTCKISSPPCLHHLVLSHRQPTHQSNGWLTESINNLMTMPHTTQEYLTLQDYLSSLHTAACFTPVCLLHWSTLLSPHTPQLPTQQFTPMTITTHQHSLGHKNTCMPIAQPFPALSTPSTDFQWLPITRTLPAHLDCPLDGPHTIHMPSKPLSHPNGPTCNPLNHMQLLALRTAILPHLWPTNQPSPFLPTTPILYSV